MDVNRKYSVAWSGDEIAVGYNLSLDYICLSFGNLATLRMLNPFWAAPVCSVPIDVGNYDYFDTKKNLKTWLFSGKVMHIAALRH